MTFAVREFSSSCTYKPSNHFPQDCHQLADLPALCRTR
jgi:hypothetical protein